MRQQINYARRKECPSSVGQGSHKWERPLLFQLLFTLLFAWLFFAHAGLLALAAPLGNRVFDQAKADHPEKGDNEGGDAREGPRRRNASLVWICSTLASTQKRMSARPTSSTGMGLFMRLELAATVESA